MLGVLLVLLAQAPSADEPRSSAIFTTPLAPVGDALLGVLNGHPPLVMVPLGVTFRAGEFQWSIDVAAVHGRTTVSGFGGATLSYLGMYLAFGPLFHTGDKPLNGWFIHPKLTLGVFELSQDRWMIDYVLGLDGGYQFTVGRLYCAFILGVGIGAGLNENDLLAGPWLDLNAFIKPGLNVVLGLNVHLFRLGFAF